MFIFIPFVSFLAPIEASILFVTRQKDTAKSGKMVGKNARAFRF
jgi:hypothetical protein